MNTEYRLADIVIEALQCENAQDVSAFWSVIKKAFDVAYVLAIVWQFCESLSI